jgi:hypothetical protein
MGMTRKEKAVCTISSCASVKEGNITKRDEIPQKK